jgi:transposase
MPKAYSLDLRERVVRFVQAGHSRHAAAAHFAVSVSFVVNLMQAYSTSGRIAPRPSAAADGGTPNWSRTAGFFWRGLRPRTTSPCRNWRLI